MRGWWLRLVLGPIRRVFTFLDDGEVIKHRKRPWEESRCWHTRGLTWTYKDKGAIVNVAGWENQMHSINLGGWELERLLLLEMWGESLEPGQDFPLHGWIRNAMSLTRCVEESCIVLMWEPRENSGNTQVTRLSDKQEDGIAKSKRESSSGEELGRELRNFLLKYWAWIGSGKSKTGQQEDSPDLEQRITFLGHMPSPL